MTLKVQCELKHNPFTAKLNSHSGKREKKSLINF